MRYAIGDIHGHYNKMCNLIARICKQDPNPEFIFMGDYGDRGPDSRQVIVYLIEFSKYKKCTFLRGNHDDVINYLLGNKPLFDLEYFCPSRSDDEITKYNKIYTWWRKHGLEQFLDSYTIRASDTVLTTYIAAYVPDSHKEFFNKTRLFHAEVVNGKTYLFVHAHIPISHFNFKENVNLIANAEIFPNEGNSGNIIYPCLWQSIRPIDLDRGINIEKHGIRYNQDEILVVGHTPCINLNDKSHHAIIGNGIIAIDSGVCFGGHLTAYCLETESFIVE